MSSPSEPAVLETSSTGDLRIPAEILGTGPGVRFRIEHDGETLRLVPETPPAGRARAFRDWVARLPKRSGRPIPAEALRRENLYD